jgi:hypothetical protein
MQYCGVSDGDAIANQAGILLAIHMDDGVVLNAGFVTDADVIYVAAYGDVWPDAGALTNYNIADDLSA